MDRITNTPAGMVTIEGLHTDQQTGAERKEYLLEQ